ncbi:hypothetical protein SLU01_09040 [Sporosarcina luteola]|uniref:Uncharacterized protein n=1 Tax=Sporosarcina luteola TaxID=582850 RepID=A0A511Z5C2_9BACL|nr:hypothetical protein SLU01_09040 [Sporosarcina luteola]
MLFIIGFIVVVLIVITLFSIENHLKNSVKQNDEIIDLLKQMSAKK